MINYSISARPNPLKKDEDPLYYATAQMTEAVTLDEFAKHISDHNSKYNRADIAAVLTQAVDCMREMLLEGKKIQLGDLGAFYIGLNSRGALTSDNFNPAIHIKDVHVNWTPGANFKNLIEEVEWNHVASREVQQKLLKAIAAGETTIDISKPQDEEEEGAAD